MVEVTRNAFSLDLVRAPGEFLDLLDRNRINCPELLGSRFNFKRENVEESGHFGWMYIDDSC